MRWRCSRHCVREGSDARLWLPGAREAGARGLYRRTRSARPRRSASPTRSRSRRRPTPSPRPMPPATWCCSCRASRKRSAARWSRRCGRPAGARLGAWRRRRTAARSCSRRARSRRSTATALACSARGACWPRPPTPAVTIPHTLRAMQEATLAVYAELIDRLTDPTQRARRAGAGRRRGCWRSSRCGRRRAMPKACWCWARWRRSSSCCSRVSAAARSC